MNTCPNCGKVAGLHSSILQGCMCQYSMQAMKEGEDFTISKLWVGLTDEEVSSLWEMAQAFNPPKHFYLLVEAKLKEKNT